jgi:hypothetical protein
MLHSKTLALISLLLVGLLIAGYYTSLVMYFVGEIVPIYPLDSSYLLEPPTTTNQRAVMWKATIKDMGILGVTPAIGLHVYFVWLAEVLIGDKLEGFKSKIVKISRQIKFVRKIYKAQDNVLYRNRKRA